jgi:hypothetical protein
VSLNLVQQCADNWIKAVIVFGDYLKQIHNEMLVSHVLFPELFVAYWILTINKGLDNTGIGFEVHSISNTKIAPAAKEAIAYSIAS